LWMLDEYRLTADDVYLQKTATTFDVSLWGYFLPLMVGAKLVVAAPDGHADPVYLAETIRRHRVTVTDFAPSMLTVFVAHATAEQCATLRAVFVIGEALPPETVARFHELVNSDGAAPTGLHNLYGPTEAAVSVTHRKTTTDDTATVPIGVPEWNVEVYVLDSRLRPAAIGAPGELYLGGRQLARGYHRRPDLTADRFVANPFGTNGERMYRTGDLVRWTTDGELEYLGRTDFQIKFRGQRIELGEIENTLLAQASVAQAVVVVADTVIGQQLVAYVVPSPGRSISPTGLRTTLFASQPAAAVPAAIIVLDSLPINASGKVDRRALPPYDLVTEAADQLPRTTTEHLVARTFTDVLGVASVGCQQDFYELGGNSLLAFQLRNALTAETGVPIPLREFFRAPTVKSIAGLIDGRAELSTSSMILADAQLDLSTPESALPDKTESTGTYLLTGSSGFLGTYLLSELIEQTDAQIWCLVRAGSEESAAREIVASMLRYGLWKPSMRDRIVAIPGDLTLPRLALDPEVYDAVCAQTDVIIHCGAQINHVDEYERLRGANVESTRELLRIATSVKTKPIHFISTTAMFGSYPDSAGVPISEQVAPTLEQVEHSGYLATKWVSETLMRKAASHGIPTAVYRLCLIGGDTRTGASSLGDAFWAMIRASAILGMAPATDDFSVQLVPVDTAAAAIVGISTSSPGQGETYHIVDPTHVRARDILDQLRDRGHRIEEVPQPVFEEKLRAEAAARVADGDYSLAGAALLAVAGDWKSLRAMHFDDRNVRNALSGTDIAPLALNADIIGRYLDYFERVDYLPAPVGHAVRNGR
uniref:thioester reductase domain-containing protein n=1 Tax=Nocardia lijiangensis TaxID=299618 RepID=UPI003D7526F9